MKKSINNAGIQFYANFIQIKHSDGTRAVYAHIKKDGALISVGTQVKQGQPIAYSGMVGQTINPHLHFVVFNQEETASLPVSFADLPDRVPRAGRTYESGNIPKD